MNEKEVKARVRRANSLMRASWNPEPSRGLLQRQTFSRRRRSFKPGLWISETTISICRDEALRSLFLRAVHELDDINNVFHLPNTSEVSIEWSGCQRMGEFLQDTISLSARERYDALMQHRGSDFTVLFVHGGGFVSDPSRIRGTEYY